MRLVPVCGHQATRAELLTNADYYYLMRLVPVCDHQATMAELLTNGDYYYHNNSCELEMLTRPCSEMATKQPPKNAQPSRDVAINYEALDAEVLFLAVTFVFYLMLLYHVLCPTIFILN